MQYTNNWLAIVVAVIVNFVVGWLWYGAIFGKLWMKLSGHSPQSMEEMKKTGATPTRGYIVNIVLSVITPFVFFSLAQTLLLVGFGEAAMLAFLLWLGFQVPVSIGTVLWDAKPMRLFILHAAYQLLSLFILAALYTWLVLA